MGVSSGTSFIMASISFLLIFSGMQMYKPWLASSQLHTIFGGYLGSLLFTLLLTTVGNLETCVFGKAFQVKIFPEILFCLCVAVFSSATIHRVCSTVCLVFSLVQLYYINKYSQKVYTVPTVVPVVQAGKKKK